MSERWRKIAEVYRQFEFCRPAVDITESVVSYMRSDTEDAEETALAFLDRRLGTCPLYQIMLVVKWLTEEFEFGNTIRSWWSDPNNPIRKTTGIPESYDISARGMGRYCPTRG